MQVLKAHPWQPNTQLYGKYSIHNIEGVFIIHWDIEGEGDTERWIALKLS